MNELKKKTGKNLEKAEAEQKPKKPKSEDYVMKKNNGIKMLRIILWIMLGFVFVRG